MQFELEVFGVLDVGRTRSERGLHQTRPFKLHIDIQCASDDSVIATGFYPVDLRDITELKLLACVSVFTCDIVPNVTSFCKVNMKTSFCS